MEHSLHAFCTCPLSAYKFLKTQIDSCALRGQSYEFASCRLFPGCIPQKAAVGFRKDFYSSGYQLYFRPAVRCEGPNPRLVSFFRQPVHSFSDFDALVQGLRILVPHDFPVLPEIQRIKNPPTDLFKNPPGDRDDMAALGLLQALGREYGLNITRIAPTLVPALNIPADRLNHILKPALLRARANRDQWDTWMLAGTSEQLRLLPLTH